MEQTGGAGAAGQPGQYRMLFEQSGEAIFVTDPTAHVADANRAFCRLVGYEREQLVGRHIRELVDPDDLAATPLQLDRLVTEQVVVTQRRLLCGDGGRVDTEVTATRMTDGTMQGIVRELRHRRIEADLARHALLFHALLDGVVFADADGRITDWNPAAARMYGYAREEVIGRRADFLHPPGRGADFEEIIGSVTERGYWSGEVDFVRRDGSPGVSETVVVAVHDDDGVVVGSIGVNRDVTERRVAASEVERLDRQREAVLQSAGEGIWGLDAAGMIAFVNRAAEQTLGWSADELLGGSSHELTHHTRADGTPYPHEQCPILATLRGGGASRVDDEVFWRKDGSSFPVSYTSTPIVEDGEVTGVVVVFRDVTEQRELEEQLRQAQRIEAIGRLAGGVAHDFNNILTAINGYTALLREHLAEGPALADVDGLQEAADRAAALTRQLLAFSRQQVMELRPVDVDDAVRETSRLLARLLPETIELRLELGGVGCVNADPGQLTQVLMNLTLNARDAMPAGGTIAIETSVVAAREGATVAGVALAPGEYALVCVADTGEGMEPAVLDRAFDPFYTTKPVGQGTGLGLSTVYGIVKQTGGYVFVRSDVGAGTTVEVYLPVTAEPTTAEPPAGAVTPVAAGPSRRVLLVEDEEAVRTLLADVLRSRGFHVTSAASGEEAIAWLAHGREVDVVVTDMVMPGTSGLEVAAAVQERHPAAKAVYISGYAPEIAGDPGSPTGTFLQKPFGMHDLVAAVERVLAG